MASPSVQRERCPSQFLFFELLPKSLLSIETNASEAVSGLGPLLAPEDNLDDISVKLDLVDLVHQQGDVLALQKRALAALKHYCIRIKSKQ